MTKTAAEYFDEAATLAEESRDTTQHPARREDSLMASMREASRGINQAIEEWVLLMSSPAMREVQGDTHDGMRGTFEHFTD